MKKVLIVLAALAITAASGVAFAETTTSSCDPTGCTYVFGDGFTVFCSAVTNRCVIVQQGKSIGSQ